MRITNAIILPPWILFAGRALSFLVLAATLLGCEAVLSQPIDGAFNRPTPLSFGMYVTPDPRQNPIRSPERFTGYHVGLDFEVSEAERERDVPVHAVCSGLVRFAGFAEGYGGVVVQECNLFGETGTVLYGHLALAGLPQTDSLLSAEQRIGVLAPPRSYESGGNRKHLHLGIHRGDALDLRGYVQHEDEIEDFIDPKDVLPRGLSQATRADIVPYWETSNASE